MVVILKTEVPNWFGDGLVSEQLDNRPHLAHSGYSWFLDTIQTPYLMLIVSP